MRAIKFRQFFNGKFHYWGYLKPGEFTAPITNAEAYGLESQQFTGLKDRNGKEIYEFMELDNKWEVNWINGKYVLCDISNSDIIDLDYENKYEITKEYTKI